MAGIAPELDLTVKRDIDTTVITHSYKNGNKYVGTTSSMSINDLVHFLSFHFMDTVATLKMRVCVIIVLKLNMCRY